MKFPLVIFDFDGTLADTFPWFLKVMNVAAEKFRFKKLAPGEQEALRGLENREVLKYLEVPMWKLPAISKEMRRMAEQEPIPLFPGTADLLANLKAQGHTLGIVTSNSRVNLERILGANARHIDEWECGASLFGKKSKLKKLIKRSGKNPAEAVYIGDELRDADAAAESGIAFGAVAWGFALPSALKNKNPALFFEEMSEIPLKLR